MSIDSINSLCLLLITVNGLVLDFVALGLMIAKKN